MSSPLSIKRRRLNESAARLSKPFVSPLRTNKSEAKAATQATGDNKENEDLYLPSTHAHGTRIPASPQANSLKRPTPPESTLRPTKPTPTRKPAIPSFSSKRKDAAELQAERALTALEAQIRAVKNDLDTLNQASRIRGSTTDADLEALSQKWKTASQAAAEELFGSVKERVNRMGGVAAWRESEKRKYERSHGMGEFRMEAVEEVDDADCEFDSQGEELPEEEQEWRKREKARVKREMVEAADVEDVDGGELEMREEGGKEKAVWQEVGEEDDAFTMDMMLRSLNIELKVIGYDKQAQRWVA